MLSCSLLIYIAQVLYVRMLVLLKLHRPYALKCSRKLHFQAVSKLLVCSLFHVTDARISEVPDYHFWQNNSTFQLLLFGVSVLCNNLAFCSRQNACLVSDFPCFTVLLLYSTHHNCRVLTEKFPST